MLPLLLTPLALAAPTLDAPVTYALVVGSNRPGPGQQALRFADQDAARFAEVLDQVGGVDPSRIMRLADPAEAELEEAIDGFAQVMEAHATQGEPTTFLFYYSGHARARGLDLGPDRLPLEALRARLEALHATFTLVVLDACQSGAPSEIKGVEAAADFSTSSVGALSTEGIAIIASSTGAELSQESAELGGSFFTHHLATGLRGAADLDVDGAVTLAEAYQYAYHRTLVDTAATAVGAQHPTLETDLRGKGDLVLSRPAVASARLRFPAELAGEILLVRAPHDLVAAEIHKAEGEAFDLALLPGTYHAMVHQGEEGLECPLHLSAGPPQPFTLDGCTALAPVIVASKGEGQPSRRRLENWMIETGLGGLSAQQDAYDQRLEDFGFGTGLQIFPGKLTWSAGLSWSPERHLAVVGTVGKLDDATWTRTMGVETEEKDHFSWMSTRLALAVRAQLPLLHDWLVPYVQAGGGPAWTRTRFTDEAGEDHEVFWGPHLDLGGGLQLMPTVGRWRHLGIFNQVEYVRAPVLQNLVGDTHDVGGLLFTAGLRAGF